MKGISETLKWTKRTKRRVCLCVIRYNRYYLLRNILPGKYTITPGDSTVKAGDGTIGAGYNF